MSHGCDYFEELIFTLPDTGLTDDEADALRAHLRTCPDCRRLFRAFADATETLKSDSAEPPAELAEGAMARVYAYEKVRSDMAREQNTTGEIPVIPVEGGTLSAAAEETDETREEAPVPISRARKPKRAARRWVPVAAAACLVAVIGGAAAVSGIFAPRSSSGAAKESIVMEAAAEAPAPLMEEAPAMDGGAMLQSVQAPMEAAAERVPAAEGNESAEAADMADMAAAEAPVRAVYTWENPAQVPEGREADFERLIGSAAMDGELPENAFHVTAAVEYHGIIYEFLTDDSENLLLWQDAAESAYPVLSPGTVEDLWEIIG